MLCVGCAPGVSKAGGRIKDVAPGLFVRAEAWRQSAERQQGWSRWIWTGEVNSHHLCEQRVRSSLRGENNQEISQ